MNQIFAVATNTFREAIRNRILYIILVFALLLIGASGVLSELSIASHERIMKDLGFAAINLFAVAIAVFVGVNIVYNELEKKTIYTIVSKPIARWQFLLGKYFGLLLTIYVNVLIMSVCFLFMLHFDSFRTSEESVGFMSASAQSVVRAIVNLVLWNRYEATAHMMPVVIATLIELSIVTAFAILYSSFSMPTLSMIFTVLTFIAGRMNDDITEFAKTIKRNALAEGLEVPFSYDIARWLSYVTPNLDLFHRTVEEAIYNEGKYGLDAAAFAYAALYTTAVLCLAMLVFGRRNFK